MQKQFWCLYRKILLAVLDTGRWQFPCFRYHTTLFQWDVLAKEWKRTMHFKQSEFVLISSDSLSLSSSSIITPFQFPRSWTWLQSPASPHYLGTILTATCQDHRHFQVPYKFAPFLYACFHFSFTLTKNIFLQYLFLQWVTLFTYLVLSQKMAMCKAILCSRQC